MIGRAGCPGLQTPVVLAGDHLRHVLGRRRPRPDPRRLQISGTALRPDAADDFIRQLRPRRRGRRRAQLALDTEAARRHPDRRLSASVGDTLFTICPWWTGRWPKAASPSSSQRDAAKERARWIWIYHAPPEGALIAREVLGAPRRRRADAMGRPATSPIWSSAATPTMHCGSGSTGSWIDKIGATWVHECRTPDRRSSRPHIVIDTTMHAALWLSARGSANCRSFPGSHDGRLDPHRAAGKWFTAHHL